MLPSRVQTTSVVQRSWNTGTHILYVCIYRTICDEYSFVCMCVTRVHRVLSMFLHANAVSCDITVHYGSAANDPYYCY